MRTFVPAADIYEDLDAFKVILEMPGVEKTTSRSALKKGAGCSKVVLIWSSIAAFSLYTEYNIGNYSRSFRLSNAIDQDKIGAELKDGMLLLTLPKAEKAKPRTIQVS